MHLNPYLIRSRQDADALVARLGGPPPRLLPLRIEIDAMPAADRDYWQSRFEEIRGKCGCRLSATFLAATIALGTISLGAGPVRSAFEWSAGFLGVGAAALLAALAGKLIGLARARRRGRRAWDDFTRALAETVEPSGKS